MSLDKNRKIHIVDTTLRDGSHAVSHSYTVEQVTAIASGLDKTSSNSPTEMAWPAPPSITDFPPRRRWS